MKEMVYKKQRELVLLEYNNYKGYNYAVVSQGTHPCGYVEIPSKHPYYKKRYNDCDILCHGGLTFSGKLSDELALPSNTFWLGWDYAHYGDLCGYDFLFGFMVNGKVYSTTDVVQECRYVIDQLEALQCNT